MEWLLCRPVKAFLPSTVFAFFVATALHAEDPHLAAKSPVQADGAGNHGAGSITSSKKYDPLARALEMKDGSNRAVFGPGASFEISGGFGVRFRSK